MKADIDRPTLRTTTHETATSWTQLGTELRMLCRGLSPHDGWSPSTVTTFVGVPGDAEYEQALVTLCRRLAEEYGLGCRVAWQDATWCVSFTRPEGDEPTVAACPAESSGPRQYGLLAGLARACAGWRRGTDTGGRAPGLAHTAPFANESRSEIGTVTPSPGMTGEKQQY